MVVIFTNRGVSIQRLSCTQHVAQIKRFIRRFSIKFSKLQQLVVQSNSIFNFFNQVTESYRETSSLSYLQKVQSQNSLLWIAAPTWSKSDSLNNSHASYLEVSKLKKSVTLSFLSNYFLTQWAHLAFRGKSFRIRNFSSHNKLTLNFGYSHWTRLKLNERWAFFKRRRQSYVIYTWSINDFSPFTRFFPHIRFYNKYTMRGLRLRKQPIIRRFGKISQHISILH